MLAAPRRPRYTSGRHMWFTVKRQAMAFGTTSGDLWASRDEGQTWRRIAEHLPEIYSVVAAHRR